MTGSDGPPPSAAPPQHPQQPAQEINLSPDSKSEENKLFETPEETAQKRILNKRLKLENKQFKRDIGNREAFADKAYGFTQTWLGFIIVLTCCQFSLKHIDLGLTQTEFVTVVTTTTASILGFWLLVGKYLFKAGEGDKDAKKPHNGRK